MRFRHCAGCGHRVSAHARFCERCGAALTARARPLRAPTTLEARILERRTAIEGERKQVTVMYADVVGSMELTRSLEAERWGFVLDRFLAIAAGAIHAFEGTVNQFTGDGLLAVFGAPLAHEDHARRACLAALGLRREVAGLAAELARSDGVSFAIRCGLHSGEVVVGAIGDDVHMDFVPLGNTTALGRRIESLAPAGSAAISASTAALVEGEFELRELGEFHVKGAIEPERVLELIGPGAAQTRLRAMAATRGLSRFVGRDAERAQLESALEHARVGHGRAVGIVGEAGVGKSRLAHEFVADCLARGLSVISAACVAHGRDVPLLPVLALCRDCLGVDERDPPELVRGRIETAILALDPAFAADLPLLLELLGVPGPERPQAPYDPDTGQPRLLALAGRIVRALGGRGTAVLVVEDLHWIDDASAAFLDVLVEAAAGARIVVVGTYRPEYEAAWLAGGPHIEVTLDPLDARAREELLDGLLGHDPSLHGLAELIEARAGGNPFFIEEIVQALAESGHITGARGAYRRGAEPERPILPATVQAGLAARIDGLAPREKALVHTMSVIGAEISGPLLSEVCDLPGGELADAIALLADARMVRPRDASGGDAYGFNHPLTREVAYGSQLSAPRARTHAAVAAAIERTCPDGLDERAALLAHHREAAGDMLAAARWHARAADRATITSLADAMRHWRRVRRLASELAASPERDALASKARTGILSLAWRLGLPAEEGAAVHAEGLGDVERFGQHLHYAGTLMHGAREREGLERFRQASRDAVAAGDRGWVLTASLGVAYASWIAGSLSEAVRTLDRALAATGDDPTTGSLLSFVCPFAHAYGHRGQCRGYMGELEAAHLDAGRAIELAREHDDPQTESAIHANLALLEADAGAFEGALRHAALGLAIAERTGDVTHAVACLVPAAVARAGTGHLADALAQAEAHLATIRRHGIGLYYEPLLLATIARCELGLGRPDGALAAAEKAVDVMRARRLATCALQAPIVLAQVLIATRGAAAGERIEDLLARASLVAREAGARLFEPMIGRELAALAHLRETQQPPLVR